jgi:hypothetical protein
VRLSRRIFAVLAVSGILLAAAISLAITFSNPSADVDSSPLLIQTMYRSYDETERLWPNYVSDEVIIKFRKEVTEGEIVGLRIGQGAEEAYVSSFTFARTWKVPPSCAP